MDNYELYINGIRADLNDGDSRILLTFQRTDYTNPTAIRNSYSKTITLPGTTNNSRIFNSIYKLDRIQTPDLFNPSKRVPFQILKSGNLVEAGYIKLDSVQREGTYKTYSITLYGELGNILYQLTYDYSDPTKEAVKLNLGDLQYETDLGFTIWRDTVEEAWNRLADENKTGTSKYDTLNFCVAYNGIPNADNFDPSYATIKYNDWDLRDDLNESEEEGEEGSDPIAGVGRLTSGVMYTYDGTNSLQLPASWTEGDEEDATTFGPILGHMALMKMEEGATDLEMRDLRSYLQRPVLRTKKVFEAISRFMDSRLGYTLDLSDEFFTSVEYNDSWITLSMLYEIKPEVETGTKFTQKELLSLTSDPASYLTSYCKTYGLYVDVDIASKKVIPRRIERFYFGGDIVEGLEIDQNDVKINPLSFDKNNYTFDYAEGESEFQTQYKDTYNLQYGSKRVKTGYEFDADSGQYIENNIFRNGLDAIETSKYYCQRLARKSGDIPENSLYDVFKYGLVPTPLVPINSKIEYIMFDSEGNQGTKEIYTVNNSAGLFKYYSISEAKEFWGGLKEFTFQDQFPKLQCHGEDNSPTDGKDILVWFNGMIKPDYCTFPSKGSPSYREGNKDEMQLPFYVLSDDIQIVKDHIEKNCWTIWKNNNAVSEEVYSITRCSSIPCFARALYRFDCTPEEPEYVILDSLDFGENRELYVASTRYDMSLGFPKVIYNKYWGTMIGDLYSVNTRVVDCRVKMPNINDAFRKFYYFDNSYWILSKLVDYDYQTLFTTAQFIKVNNISHYTDFLKVTPRVVYVDNNDGTFTLYVDYSGEGTPEVSTTFPWVHITRSGQGRYLISFDSNDGPARVGKIEVVADTGDPVTKASETVTINQGVGSGPVPPTETATLTINATPDDAEISFDDAITASLTINALPDSATITLS